MDMPLDRTLGPRQREPSLYRFIVLLERLGEATQFGDALPLNLLQPEINSLVSLIS